MQVLVCSIGTATFALPLTSVIETMRPLRIEPLAQAPRGVLGVAMIRGAPTIVVDAAGLLEQPAPPPSRFVTLRTADRVVALAVQRVIGVQEILDDVLRDLPPLLRDQDAVQRIAARDRDLMFVLNASRMISELPEVA